MSILTPRCWAILLVAAAILVTCFLVIWRHESRTKRGKLRMRKHLRTYPVDGWRMGI